MYFRKGTIMVMSASAIFLVLMIPRGVIIVAHTLHLGNSTFSIWFNIASWWLQYLKHSINLFVYMIFIKPFRPCHKSSRGNTNTGYVYRSRVNKANTCTTDEKLGMEETEMSQSGNSK